MQADTTFITNERHMHSQVKVWTHSDQQKKTLKTKIETATLTKKEQA